MDGDHARDRVFGAAGGELPDAEKRLLDFEGQWFRRPGSKEQAMRDTFGLNATRYYQWINAVVDKPEAMAHDPALVKRLRNRRDSHARTRTARRFGTAG